MLSCTVSALVCNTGRSQCFNGIPNTETLDSHNFNIGAVWPDRHDLNLFKIMRVDGGVCFVYTGAVMTLGKSLHWEGCKKM